MILSTKSSLLPTTKPKTPIFLFFIQLLVSHNRHRPRNGIILTSAFSSIRHCYQLDHNNQIKLQKQNLIRRKFMINSYVANHKGPESSLDMEAQKENILQKEEPLSIILALKIISLISNDNSKQQTKENKQPKVTIAIAGGGSTSISSLTSISKSSSIFLEGNILYSKESFIEYISKNKSSRNSNPFEFGFSSVESATVLSKTSLQRSYDYTLFNDRICSIGIGCASSLKSGENERKGRVHKCFVRLSDVWGYTCGYDCVIQPSYSRIEQEELCGSLVLYTLFKYILEKQDCYKSDDESDTKEVLTHADKIFNKAFVTLDYAQHNDKRSSIEDGIEGILSNRTDSILLLPNDDKKINVIQNIPNFLPKQSIIIPGSFNPIHIGHVTLAKAAYDKFITTRSQDDSSMCTTPLILFEISIINADKPPLKMDDILKRINTIETTLSKQEDVKNWGIVLTSSPLFAQKVNIFQNRINRSNSQAFENEDSKVSMVLVIGADTFVRILNKKYYDNNIDNMIKAIREMKSKGVLFIIGGRLEQTPGSTSKKFINGEELIDTLPDNLKDMFIFLNENDFRVDVSSTEIRKRQEEQFTEN